MVQFYYARASLRNESYANVFKMARRNDNISWFLYRVSENHKNFIIDNGRQHQQGEALFIVASLVYGGLCQLLGLLCSTLYSFYFCNHLAGELYFDVMWLLLFLSPFHGAVGWSAVCDCGIPGHTHLLFIVFASMKKNII